MVVRLITPTRPSTPSKGSTSFNMPLTRGRPAPIVPDALGLATGQLVAHPTAPGPKAYPADSPEQRCSCGHRLPRRVQSRIGAASLRITAGLARGCPEANQPSPVATRLLRQVPGDVWASPRRTFAALGGLRSASCPADGARRPAVVHRRGTALR
jgi:hypothetical protein